MSSGVMGNAALSANTVTNLGQGAVGIVTAVTVRFVNRDKANPTMVQLGACAANNSIANSEHLICPNITIPPGGKLEDTFVVGPGEYVNVLAATSSVTARAIKFEQAA